MAVLFASGTYSPSRRCYLDLNDKASLPQARLTLYDEWDEFNSIPSKIHVATSLQTYIHMYFTTCC